MTSIRLHQQRLVVLSGLFLTCYSFTVHVVYPLQTRILSEQWIPVYLLFLPHAVRVLGAWLYGWTSVLYLLPGAVAMALIWSPVGPLRPEAVAMYAATLLSAPLSFELIHCWRGTAQDPGQRRMDWRMTVMAGLLAGAFNALALLVTVGYAQPLGDRISAMVTVLLGNLLGMVASLFILLLGFRLVERHYLRRRRGSGGF